MQTFSILLFLVAFGAFADEGSKNKINDLQLNHEALEVQTEIVDGKSQEFVILRGKYSQPKKWALIVNTDKVKVGDDGHFEVKMPCQGNEKLDLQLKAIGPFGEVEGEEVSIELIRIRDPEQNISSNKIVVVPELGLSTISYQETGISNYSEIALTAKVSARRQIFSPRWDLGVNTYFTLLPLKKSTDVTVRFLGANLRVGYVFPFFQPLWKLTLYGGGYYTTMFVTKNQFGFDNMGGPQLFPMLQRTLKNDQLLRGYLKISTVSTDKTNSLFSFKSRELAVGLTYVRPLSNRHLLSVSADLAQLKLTFAKATIQSTSFTLGCGYSL